MKDCIYYKKNLKSKNQKYPKQWNNCINITTEDDNQAISTIPNFAFMAQGNPHNPDNDEYLISQLSKRIAIYFFITSDAVIKALAHCN